MFHSPKNRGSKHTATANLSPAAQHTAGPAMASAAPKDDPWSVADTIGQSAPVDCSQPYDASALAGKTILITGGASGFGAAFARHWARHGAHVIIGDVNDDAGERLVAELRSSSPPGQRFCYQHCDVTRWRDQVSLFRAAVAASPTGGIDAVVAAAGIVETRDPHGPEPVFDHPRALDADEPQPPPPPPLDVLAVNLTGVMYTAHLALFWLPRNLALAASRSNSQARPQPQPQPPRDAHLLLVSSIAGLSPLPAQTEYTVSKHGVMGLFRALRATAWTRGVRVNVLAPYFVDTPLLPTAALALLAGAAKGELADVVDAATRLVADSRIRGRALVVGPKMRVTDDGDMDEQAEREGEGARSGEGPGVKRQAVWEVYGHDYERVEVFVWRYVAMLNIMRTVRGWVGLVKDLWAVYISGRGRGRR